MTKQDRKPTRSRNTKKSPKNVELDPRAGLALVELVNELQKIDQYEQDKKEAAYTSFHNGIPIHLYAVLRPDSTLERRRQEIITQIMELLDNGR